MGGKIRRFPPAQTPEKRTGSHNCQKLLYSNGVMEGERPIHSIPPTVSLFIFLSEHYPASCPPNPICLQLLALYFLSRILAAQRRVLRTRNTLLILYVLYYYFNSCKVVIIGNCLPPPSSLPTPPLHPLPHSPSPPPPPLPHLCYASY